MSYNEFRNSGEEENMINKVIQKCKTIEDTKNLHTNLRHSLKNTVVL